MQGIRYFTAETAQGRQAIEEVMEHSYAADLHCVPARWALVRVVDDVPVSYILIDPAKQMAFPNGDMRYAFVNDVATRRDRRGQGHFGAIMQETFRRLRQAGLSLIILHGRFQLYRRFGFDVFTHHCGLFVTPESIERTLGTEVAEGAGQLLVLEESRYVREDLLLVTEVEAGTLRESKTALQAAAKLARRQGKRRILFEHPAAPSYGSRYPIHPSPETPFTRIARGRGAQVCLQGADPESGTIPDADWIKVLDAAAFVREAVARLSTDHTVPAGRICFETEAGFVAVECANGRVNVSTEIERSEIAVKWPSSALAQLVTGYQSVEILDTVCGPSLPDQSIALLDALFPPRWRFSRNESWTYRT